MDIFTLHYIHLLILTFITAIIYYLPSTSVLPKVFLHNHPNTCQSSSQKPAIEEEFILILNFSSPNTTGMPKKKIFGNKRRRETVTVPLRKNSSMGPSYKTENISYIFLSVMFFPFMLQ